MTTDSSPRTSVTDRRPPAGLADPLDPRYPMDLDRRIVEAFPRRAPTSDDERGAQELVKQEFERLGLKTTVEPFRFNANLYQNLSLHTGLATLASVLSVLFAPAAFVLHLLVGISLFCDTTRKAYLLRRLLPFRPSQNVLATLPSEGDPKLRVVLMAHIDAATTGLIFNPKVGPKLSRKKWPLGLHRTLAVVTYSQFALAAFDLVASLAAPLPGWAFIVLGVLSVMPAGTLVFNLDIALRNQVVPGAADDVSGVAALPVLAARLAKDKPQGLEIVLASTGCEEASMGGSDALAKSMKASGRWDPANTIVVALDTLTNGKLSYFVAEGDVVRIWIPPPLVDAMKACRPDIVPFDPPLGGTDAHAFLAAGYPACSVICVDPAFGVPREYHQMTDTPDRLDPKQLADSIDFAEALVRELARRRLAAA
ncbi:MAG: M20/M25/M40 family metallo-hydrolase [Myxococcales bacterium]